MLTLGVENQSNGALSHLRGKLVRGLAHDAPSYSRVGASGKPGAVQEQLFRLLRTVSFEEIDLTRPNDLDEMTQLTYAYARKADVDFGPLATQDFLERLAFACCHRWGLVI